MCRARRRDPRAWDHWVRSEYHTKVFYNRIFMILFLNKYYSYFWMKCWNFENLYAWIMCWLPPLREKCLEFVNDNDLIVFGLWKPWFNILTCLDYMTRSPVLWPNLYWTWHAWMTWIYNEVGRDWWECLGISQLNSNHTIFYLKPLLVLS